VTGLSLEEFREITDRVSKDQYDGNVIVQAAHATGPRRFTGRLAVTWSRGPGARRSWTGRHIPAACAHAYRDVLAAVFDAYPDATMRTPMGVYRGRQGFRQNYPEPGWQYVGSIRSPLAVREPCDCDDRDLDMEPWLMTGAQGRA
jgi:hypothetical protein